MGRPNAIIIGSNDTNNVIRFKKKLAERDKYILTVNTRGKKGKVLNDRVDNL